MTREAKIIYTAEDRTKAAVDSVKKGFGQVNEMAAMAGLTLAGLGTAGTLAGLVALVKSTNDAIDALNDIKDATGASIENLSALEDVAKRNGHSWESTGSMLVKFNQVLNETRKPGAEAEKILRALNLNAKELREMDPAEAVHKTAIAFSKFAEDGERARALQLLFGKSTREAAAFMNDLAEQQQLNAKVTTEQTEQAERFNKMLFAMQTEASDLGRTVSLKLVDSFLDLRKAIDDGNVPLTAFMGVVGAGSAAAAIGATARAVTVLSASVVGLSATLLANPVVLALLGLGAVGGAVYAGVKAQAQSASGIADAIATLEEANQRSAIALKRAEEAGRVAGAQNIRRTIDERLGKLRELRAELTLLSTAEADADGSYGRAEAARLGRGSASDAKPRVRLPADPDSQALKAAEQYAALIGRVKERITLSEQELALGRKLTEAEKLEIDVLGDLAEKKLKLTPMQQAAVKQSLAELKASEQRLVVQRSELALAEDIATARQQMKNTDYEQSAQGIKEIEAGYRAANEALNEQIQAQKDEAAALKMSAETGIELKTAIELVTIARLRDRQERLAEGSEGWLAVDKEIAARQELARLIGENERTKRAQQEQIDLLRRSDDIARDVFAQIAADGGNAFEAIGKSIKANVWNAIYELTARPFVIRLVGSMTGASDSAIAQAIGGSGGSTLGNLGSMASIGSMFSGSGGLAAASSGFAGGVFNAALGVGVPVAPGIGMAAGGLGGAMSGLMAAAPYIAAAVAIAALLSGSFKGETRVGGRYLNGVFSQGPSGGEIPGATDAVRATMAAVNASLAGLGSSDRLRDLVAGVEQSERGKGFAGAGFTLTGGATGGEGYHDLHNNRRGSMTAEQAMAAFAEELMQVRLQAIQASDAVGVLPDYVRSLGDVSKRTGAELQAAVNRVDKALAEKATLEERLFMLTSTELEQLNRARDKERAAIDDSNRALLEQVYVLEDQKRAAEEVVVAQQEVTLSLTELVEGLRNPVRTLEDIAQSLVGFEREATNLSIEIMRANGDMAGAAALQRQVETAGLTDTEIAHYDYVQSLQAQLVAINAVKKAQETARTDLMDGYAREKAALQQTIDQHRQYARTLRDFRDSLYLGELSPLSANGRTATAEARYMATIVKAQAGDTEAIAKLQEDGTNYLKSLEQSALTREQYNAGVAKVAAGLTITAAKSDSLVTTAQRELDTMTQQLTVLGLLKDTTQQGFASLLAAYQATVSNTTKVGGGGGSGGTGAGGGGARFATDGGYYDHAGNYYSSAHIAANQQAAQTQGVIGDLFWSLLGRSPDLGARDFYANWSASQIENAIKASPEYRGIHGSHALGLDYVPFNGYRAELHQGERVKTAASARAEDALVAEVRGLREDARRQTAEMILRLQNLEKRAKKVDEAGPEATISVRVVA